MSELEGKVALVTGAASGIGLAIAQLYARNGAHVCVSDIDRDAAEEAAAGIRDEGGDAFSMVADVGDAEACRALIDGIVERQGKLDIACNNAGISGATAMTGEYSIEDWHRVININLNGVFHCVKPELVAMAKNGGGAIVNMASILGQVGFANSAAYVAAKHGVVGLTRTAALEYAAQNIRVNAVGPGFIRTPLIADLENDPESLEGLVALHPIGRLGEPEEVAEVVMFLSSDRASFVTGSYYAVDGGYLAR